MGPLVVGFLVMLGALVVGRRVLGFRVGRRVVGFRVGGGVLGNIVGGKVATGFVINVISLPLELYPPGSDAVRTWNE